MQLLCAGSIGLASQSTAQPAKRAALARVVALLLAILIFLWALTCLQGALTSCCYLGIVRCHRSTGLAAVVGVRKQALHQVLVDDGGLQRVRLRGPRRHVVLQAFTRKEPVLALADVEDGRGPVELTLLVCWQGQPA